MNDKKYPQPLEALLLILGTFGLLLVVVIVYSAVADVSMNSDDFIENTRYFFIFGSSLFLVVPLAYSRWRNYPLTELFRLRPVPTDIIILSIITGITLTVAGDELDRLIGMIIPIPEWLSEAMRPLKVESTMDWILVILGAVVVAAVSEEGLFRGFFQVTLEKKGDVTRAVLLSSITWTLIHQNPYWAIQIFIIGVVIGFVAWRTNSIIPTVIIHSIYNLVAVLFYNVYGQEVPEWYIWNGHVHPLLVVAAVTGLVWSLRRFSALYRQEP